MDVGGTFTDFVVRDGEALRAYKRPSTPAEPEAVFLEELAGRGLSAVGHGTTVATNAVLEGRGAPTALVTTAGFEDLLVIGRQRRPSLYDFRVARPEPLVDRENAFGVRERVDAHGRVVRPLDPEEVEALADRLRERGVRSVAVSLLFSYLHPDHEARVERALEGEFAVSLSSRVLPEFREYERTSTTVLDAVVGPAVRTYLASLQQHMDAQVYVMRSNGGIRDARTAAARPAELLLSGPAGGVAGAKFLADRLGMEEVMTLDMGGTSADLSLLTAGQPTWTTEATVAGHPLALPVLDIATIGAGGGSIAWVDAGGALRMGPRSAGADPGPLCYDRGGTDPTLTDVDLLGGYLGAALLGGEVALRADLAEAGVDGLRRELALSRDELLAGARRVVVARMARAAAHAFARRGLDPRDFHLLAFGGAGPMHAAEVARDLEVPEVVVPPQAGAFSAFGILVSDLRLDAGRSLLRPLEGAESEVAEALATLEARLEEEVRAQGVPSQDAVWLPSLDLRYRGQSYEVNVPHGPEAATAFHELHEGRFGYAMPGEPVEVVTVRLTAVVPRPKSVPPPPAGSDGVAETRETLFAEGRRTTPVFRGRPAPGFESEGPLIVEEATSTTVVPPGSRLRVDDLGNLRIEVG